MSRKQNNRTSSSGAALRALGRTGAFLALTLLLTLIVLLGVIWVMEKGPSPTMTATFCRSMRETSAIRWIPNIFLTEAEIDAMKSQSTENAETETVNASLIHIARGSDAAAPGAESAPGAAAALTEKGSKTLAYTAYDEESRTLLAPVEVETGVSDGTTVEVLSGLAEGETVWYTYYESDMMPVFLSGLPMENA